MSSVIKGDNTRYQPFANLLPTVTQSALHTAIAREGRGGRTAMQLEQLRQTVMNEAYDEGYSRGLEVGISEGMSKAYEDAYAKADLEATQKADAMIQDFAHDLEVTVASVLEALSEWTQSAENKLTDMVSEIAREVLASELKTSRESIFKIVQQAVKEVTHSENARIRINPFDADSMNLRKVEIMSASKSIRNIEFVEDPTINGGCVIETDGGVVDASIDGKLAQLDTELGEAA